MRSSKITWGFGKIMCFCCCLLDFVLLWQIVIQLDPLPGHRCFVEENLWGSCHAIKLDPTQIFFGQKNMFLLAKDLAMNLVSSKFGLMEKCGVLEVSTYPSPGHVPLKNKGFNSRAYEGKPRVFICPDHKVGDFLAGSWDVIGWVYSLSSHKIVGYELKLGVLCLRPPIEQWKNMWCIGIIISHCKNPY